MGARTSLKELIWLAPLTFLGLISLALMRSWPMFPAPAQSRMITDAQGEKVAVPLPFRTISGNDFLEVTHAPETLFKFGNSRDRIKFATMMMSRFYPDVLRNDALWDCPPDNESLLYRSDGLTFISAQGPALFQRLGLPYVNVFADTANADEHIFAVVRTINAALGHEEQGEAFIADYQQTYEDLKRELQPETLTSLPRVLPMGSSSKNWSYLWIFGPDRTDSNDKTVGVRNAAAGFENTGRQQEAERILAMDPDIIFSGPVEDFIHDPRWQGLKAVLNKHVYGGGSGFRPGLPTWNLDSRPLGARFEAELVHPDRLQPKIRELTRAHFLKAYGYRLSDAEIDTMLGIEEQKNLPGFARFTSVAPGGTKPAIQ